jgi:formate C-acetyltransferase
MEIVSKTLPLSAKVQKGLELIEEGRFRKKPAWGEGLTILNDVTAKLPIVKRKALAIQKILSEIPVQIKEHELVVGSVVTNKREANIPEYATLAEKEVAARKLTSPLSVWGHSCPYYPKYLKLGIGGLRKIAEEKLAEIRQRGAEQEKEAWYESVIMSLDAMAEFIRRHKDAALTLAAREASAVRKGELQGIAQTAQHLLQGPPQTFQEALQAIWFVHAALAITLSRVPLGRLDQTLWPYLTRDLDSGAITINQAQELIDCFWLKCNERLQASQLFQGGDSAPLSANNLDAANATGVGARGAFLGGKTSVDRYAGDGQTDNQFMQTVTLGGLTPDGADGTNPLTYLCLNALHRLKTTWPSLYVRFHDGSPPELYERVADCIRAGCIGPGIQNDEVIIPSLVKIGIPLEHARDYSSDGCWEPHVQGRTYFRHWYVAGAEALHRVLSPESWEEVEVPLYVEELDPFRGSKAPDPYRFRSYGEVADAVKGNIDTLVKGLVHSVEAFQQDERLYNIAPLPISSAFMEGPLDSGKDITQLGTQYNFFLAELAGLSHVADSLAVIKKLCFEEKMITWPELLDAVRSNWQGREYLRQLVRTRAPAYGNDVDYVDDIARDIVEFYVETVRKHGGNVQSDIKYVTGLATFEGYTVLGSTVGATPDGRRAGEPISTNGSPSIGRAVSGPTAAVNSYVKLPLVDLPGGAILDLNLDARGGTPSQLEAFIKSFLEKGGNIISIPVNDSRKLRAAQKEPEKYRDLRVRVAGYEVYFVDLPPHHQELQIRRCEQYAR